MQRAAGRAEPGQWRRLELVECTTRSARSSWTRRHAPFQPNRNSLASKDSAKVVQVHMAVVVAVENGIENSTRLRLALLHFRTCTVEDVRQSLRAFLGSLRGRTEDLAEHDGQDFAEDLLR